MTTGWRRDIRCISSDSSLPSPGTWEWKDEHGKWNLYAASVRRLLDACLLCSVDECEITASGRSYRVELKADPQGWGQVNIETGVRRDVRCTGSMATAGGGASVTQSATAGQSVFQ